MAVAYIAQEVFNAQPMFVCHSDPQKDEERLHRTDLLTDCRSYQRGKLLRGWGLGRDIAGEMYVGAARRPVVCCFSIVDPTIRFRCELQYFYSPCSYLIKPRYLYLQALPDAAITGDVIVGFPGETEEQFQHTLDLMEKVKFDNLNTFRC